MNAIKRLRPFRYRAIWLSDIHLGFKGCKAEYLLDFLSATESDYLYLVGDIIDVWSMKRSMFWPQEHNNVIRTILGKAKNGTKVVYIPGNHDEMFRDYDGLVFGNVEIHTRFIHTTADGRCLLLLHGDEFDCAVRCGRLMAYLGDKAYSFLLTLNRAVNYVRRRRGFPYFSVAAYLKRKVKNAVTLISDFERAVAHEARKHNVDGLVYGHIHHAEIAKIGGVLYCNDGDWVESCTTLVENPDGSLQLLHWADDKHAIKSDIWDDCTQEAKIA